MADREERELLAVELIGASLASIALVMQARYEKDYPAKKEPTDATITHRQTDEEALQAGQGASDESDEEWIGHRERDFAANPRPEAQGRRSPKSRAAKAGSVQG
jgi:hypothetical protein